MQFLRDMKNQQDANTQNLADLKDMYLSVRISYLYEKKQAIFKRILSCSCFLNYNKLIYPKDEEKRTKLLIIYSV